MKYVWVVFRNLIVLGIAIAIFRKADSDYEKIVFSLLVMIYLSIEWFRLGLGTASMTAIFSLETKLLDIKKVMKETGISNTTLNPVFSEAEIAQRKRENERVQREQVDPSFNNLMRKEKEEIKAHYEFGKDKSSFIPSATLLNTIKEFSVAILQRNTAIEDYERMIKANLAVHNGAAIDEVRNGCKLRYPLSYIFNEKEIDERQEMEIKKRKEYWESSWDHILKREENNFEAFGEIRDEVEEEIAKAQKEIDRAWIKYYIEGGFISIIFFIALWNLLRGLHII